MDTSHHAPPVHAYFALQNSVALQNSACKFRIRYRFCVHVAPVNSFSHRKAVLVNFRTAKQRFAPQNCVTHSLTFQAVDSAVAASICRSSSLCLAMILTPRFRFRRYTRIQCFSAFYRILGLLSHRHEPGERNLILGQISTRKHLLWEDLSKQFEDHHSLPPLQHVALSTMPLLKISYALFATWHLTCCRKC